MALYCIMLQPLFPSGRCDAVQIAAPWQGREGRARAYRTAVSSLHAGGKTRRSECDLQHQRASRLQNTARAGELLSGFTLPESSLLHPEADCFGFLTSLPAMTLPPLQALSGETSPWPGYTPNWEGPPHPALQTKHTVRQYFLRKGKN